MQCHGNAITGIILGPLVSFFIHRVVLFSRRSTGELIHNTAYLQPFSTKITQKEYLIQKSLAHHTGYAHIAYEKEALVKREKDETFPTGRAQLQALRIIERETGIPVEVQLKLAHLKWIRRKRAKKAK